MSIRLCFGEYAKNGFEPEYMGITIYSIEELCFFIGENACLLEDDFMSPSLTEWLEKECGLADLAEELKKALRKRISLKAFVDILLDYAGFFSPERKKEILLAIVENSNMTVFEKRKAKADALLAKGQPGLAGREYERLLEQLPGEEEKLRGQIYHGCGVCLARLFYLKKAGEYFLKAYELTGQQDSLKQYLLSVRLSVTEEEYLEFLRKHQEYYEDSVQLEEELEGLRQSWEESNEAGLLAAIREEKKKDLSGWQEKIIQRIDYLKDAYREAVYQSR